MGTAHGADELGLCPHGLAGQAGAWGRYIGFCLDLLVGYGHIWTKIKSGPAGKNILRGQSDRVVKHIFVACRVSAKTEFRRWRSHAVMGFPIFNNSTKKLQ
jgi:hypothetical protein